MSRALVNVSGVCQQTLAGYAVKVSGVGWQKDDVKETGRERQYISPCLYACSAFPELDTSMPSPRPDTCSTFPEPMIPPHTSTSGSAYLQRVSSARCLCISQRASSARCLTRTSGSTYFQRAFSVQCLCIPPSVPLALDPFAYLQRAASAQCLYIPPVRIHRLMSQR